MSTVAATLATLYGACETGAAIIEKSTWVFDRCASHRRDEFFRTLQEDLQIETASGVTEHSVDDALNRLLATGEGQEILFDAYRRVCFAKSRTYGPRIIALLTAQLLNECRKSTDEEDMIFAAAEGLSDGEFSGFETAYEELKQERNDADPKREFIILTTDAIIHIHNESRVPLSSAIDAEIRPYPQSTRQIYGSWGAKLESCGLLTPDLIQDHSILKETPKRPARTTLINTKSSVSFNAPCLRLFTLLRRAKGIAHSA